MTDTPPAVESPEPAAEAPEAAPEEERSTEEILANAPPLVLPEGTTLLKQCQNCGLNIEGAESGVSCPNCGTALP